MGDHQQGLVVEHFFKVRDLPFCIGGISMRTKSNLIVDPAPSVTPWVGRLLKGGLGWSRRNRLLLDTFRVGWYLRVVPDAAGKGLVFRKKGERSRS
jgi:hypothetical protein